jgi:hypothetical protein
VDIVNKQPVIVMADHAMHMFKACEAARVNSTARACFARAELVYHKVLDGGYILGFDEEWIHDSEEFREGRHEKSIFLWKA